MLWLQQHRPFHIPSRKGSSASCPCHLSPPALQPLPPGDIGSHKSDGKRSHRETKPSVEPSPLSGLQKGDHLPAVGSPSRTLWARLATLCLLVPGEASLSPYRDQPKGVPPVLPRLPSCQREERLNTQNEVSAQKQVLALQSITRTDPPVPASHYPRHSRGQVPGTPQRTWDGARGHAPRLGLAEAPRGAEQADCDLGSSRPYTVTATPSR